MIRGEHPDRFTDDDWRRLITPTTSPPSSQAEPSPPTRAAGRPGERPCYTAPQARVIYLNGFCLGALIGFASATVFVFIVWRLTG